MDQIRTTGKAFIELEEYKGTYSLAACYEGNDGVVRKEWALKQVGRDKHAEKDTPIKVTIGDKATAISVCCQLLKELTGSEYLPINEFAGKAGKPDDVDIPF